MAYEKQAANWGVAILVSIALHLVVIGLATMSGERDGEVTSKPEEVLEESAQKPSEVMSEKTTNEKVTPVTPITPATPVAPATRTSPATPAAQVVPGTPTNDSSIPEIYTIKQGDTLTKIAKIYGLSVEEIAAANGKSVKKMNVLWVGQKIKLR